MTSEEFKRAFEIASNSKIDLQNQDIDVFDGFGLPEFKLVPVTIKQVARLIRYQAQYMNGGWDSEALDGIKTFGRSKFFILNPDQCPICDGSGCRDCDNIGSWSSYKNKKNRQERNANRRAQNAILREICGTSARAAREDMGL